MLAMAACRAAMRSLRRNSDMVSTSSVYFRAVSWNVVAPVNCASFVWIAKEFNEL
jgi:hypothetical protein